MKTPSNSFRPKPPGETNPEVQDRNLTHLAIIIIFGIFATTMPQPQVLGKLPLQYLLKNDLHVNKTQMASFFFLCGLAWYFKPFAGILTDAFPLFKTRRRHYMMFASLFAMASWVAIIFVPRTYTSLLYTAIVINVFMVLGSTVTGAYLVEAGQAMKATGRLTALRQVVTSFCGLVTGPFGGWLAASAATGSLIKTGAINGGIVLSLLPVAYLFLRERPVQNSSATVVFTNAGSQLKTIFSSGTLWFALLFIGLYYFSPGFSTPLFYKQTDELKFKPEQIGLLGTYAGAFGIIAAFLYGSLIKKFSIRTMLGAGIFLAGLGTFTYLYYGNYTLARIIESQNGFFGTLAEVALMDLAARATPKGCEGLGYSLILSMRNVALFGADILGSHLSDSKWPFAWLVFLNAGTTLFVLVFLPFLPRKIMQSRDQDVKEFEASEPTLA
ncbi:MAG TPA: MFS transporter [Fimbriimonadaceae bacterium]|jgi:MFS family permease